MEAHILPSLYLQRCSMLHAQVKDNWHETLTLENVLEETREVFRQIMEPRTRARNQCR